MKKKLLSILVFLGVSIMGYSQLAIQDTAGNTITNGDTIVVTGITGTQLADEFYVFNSGPSASMQVLCVPTPVKASGCTYSICVGTLCYSAYGDSVNFLCNKYTTPSGKNPNALYTDYNAYKSGVTIIRYDVRNSLATDSAWIYVQFSATPTGIATISTNNLHASNLYPNPATNMVSFNYHTDYTAQMNIYNSLGQMVKTISLNSAKENMSIDVSDMPSGIYICRLQAVGAESAFRKLVVSR